MVLTAAAEKTYKLFKNHMPKKIKRKKSYRNNYKTVLYLLLLLLFRLIVFGLWFLKNFCCFHIVFFEILLYSENIAL